MWRRQGRGKAASIGARGARLAGVQRRSTLERRERGGLLRRRRMAHGADKAKHVNHNVDEKHVLIEHTE